MYLRSRLMSSNIVVSFCFLLLLATVLAAKDERHCEVCKGFLEKFVPKIPQGSSEEKIQEMFMDECAKSKDKEERFCYYVGGMATSATFIVKEVTQPLSWNMPIDKVCERVSKKDPQVCDIRYDKKIDLTTVDLKTLKVKDLKKILNDLGEECKGCAEKNDFIRQIEAYKKRTSKSEL